MKRVVFLVSVIIPLVLAQSLDQNCLLTLCGQTCYQKPYCCDAKPSELYGPFLISKSYWAAAGRPTLLGDAANRDGAYKACVCDFNCSARTVAAYMEKHRIDCNHDGRVDCTDFLIIQAYGIEQCG
uniref:lysozyme n=1 Tax=Simulium nigrimanum TaxID=683695 RepID=D1FPY0_SIMNI